MEFSLSLTDDLFGAKITGKGSGKENFADHSSTIELTSNAFGQTTQRVLTVHGHVYKKSSITSSLEGGEPWTEATPARSRSQTTSSPLSEFGTPRTVLRAFERAGESVQDTGLSTLDGAQVHGFRIPLTVASLKKLAEMPGPKPLWWSQVPKGKGTTPSAKTVHLEFDVFVGSTGFLKRFTVTMKANITLSGSKTTTSSVSSGLHLSGKVRIGVAESLTFSNWGAPVSIVPPPSNEIAKPKQFVQPFEKSSTPKGAD